MPSSILAAIDLAESTDQVLAAAKEYAEAFSAKVYLVHVAEPGPTSDIAAMSPRAEDDADLGPGVHDRKSEADRLRAERRMLQALRKELSEAGVDAQALSLRGRTVDKLLLEMDRLGIDLVIVGSHAPRFLRDLFIGSTTKDVVREAPCPVLVVPPARGRRGRA